MKFRAGTHNNRTVYFQGGIDPSSERDRFVCTAQTPEGATVIAKALNDMFEVDRIKNPDGGSARYELGMLISVDANK